MFMNECPKITEYLDRTSEFQGVKVFYTIKIFLGRCYSAIVWVVVSMSLQDQQRVCEESHMGFLQVV